MVIENLSEIAWNVMAFFYDDVSNVGRAVYHFKTEVGDYDGFQQDREKAVRTLVDLGWVEEKRHGEVGPSEAGNRVWDEYRVRSPLVEDPQMPAEMIEAARQMIPPDHPAQNAMAQRLADLRDRARRNNEPRAEPRGMEPARPDNFQRAVNDALGGNAAQRRNAVPQRAWGNAPLPPAQGQRRERRKVKYRFIDP